MSNKINNQKHKIDKFQPDNDDNDDASSKKLKIDELNDYGKCPELPSEIWLKIFGYLNMKDVCRAARVSKKWRRVAYDEFLWYHLDLSDSCIDVRRLWKLFRHRCMQNVKSISICGNLLLTANKTKQSVTPALMQKLDQTCQQLSSIEIRYASLESISVNDLPAIAQLQSLRLFRCEMPVDWFKAAKQFTNLRTLDLSNTSNIRSNHLDDFLAVCSSLECLILRNCYRINDKAIEILIERNLNSLTRLDLSGTVCTNVSVHLICTNSQSVFAKLVYLNLSDNQHLKCVDTKFIMDSFEHNAAMFTLLV